MGDIARKVDGRRIFTAQFKRQVVQQLLSGQRSLAEVSRELDVTPIALRNWKRWHEAGATTAVKASVNGNSKFPVVVPLKRRLVENATAAIAEMGFIGRQGEDMVVLESDRP